MHKTNRPGMQASTKPTKIITAKPVLVPPVINRNYFPGENKQKRRQRTKLVDPHSLLKLHPFLNLFRISSNSPSLQINNHNSGVEVTSITVRKSDRKGRIRPKRRRKIVAEIRVTVFRCS
ncbi:hypothetical protein KIW84_024758 [Lathyrus oleraceus]|uniref:Uncharacterized protein n=1 Tax=Pisum sativum TaxID=3888 RepID=A0A9D4YMC4_PEA|nr:hypothetical protein KIW84_024758 [Pisum sativum]